MRKCSFVTAIVYSFLLVLVGCESRPPVQPPEPPPSSASQAKPAVVQPDLTDLDALTKTYLDRLISSGIAGQNWDSADNIYGEALVTFYAVHAMEDLGKNAPAEFPAEEVEEYLRQHFNLSPEPNLRGYSCYNQEKNTYEFEGMGAGTGASVKQATLEDRLLTLDYDVYSRAEDGTVVWSGTVEIELAPDGGWKYLTNHMQYPLYPLGGDPEKRAEFYKTYVYPLNPTGSALRYSWSTPEELEADELFFYLGFNNLLDIERDFEGCYPPDAKVPQETVEAAIQQYFDVSAEYLRTSQFYLPAENAYAMTGGFGGGAWASVLDYAENGDKLALAVGWYGPSDQEGYPIQVARLNIAKTPDGFRYLSYEISPDWPAGPIDLSA